MGRFELKIQGMTCEGCVENVTRALTGLLGVNAVRVDLRSGTAELEAAQESLDEPAVRSALASAGYTLGSVDREGVARGPRPLIVPRGGREAANRLAHSERLFRQEGLDAHPDESVLEIAVDGMRCAQCAASIEQRLLAIDGVRSAQVSYATDYALVRHDAERVKADRLLEVISQLGYGASLSGASRDRKHFAGALRLLIVAVVLLGVEIFAALTGHSDLRLLVAALAVLWPGSSFFVGAVHSLRRGRPGMDFLVALGAALALAGGILARFAGLHALHEHAHAAVYLIAALRIGKFCEARVKARASQTLMGLLEYLPGSACLLEGKAERIIRVDAVKTGDRLVVRPSERIAADGQVVGGSSQVDASLVTGEAAPVVVKKGDFVHAGSINLTGQLEVEVSAAGRKSLIAQMAVLTRRFLEQPAPAQRLADRIASWFVPIVVVLALAALSTALLSGADAATACSRVLATIVVACPCALSLAVPTALMAAAAQGMDHGLLIRDPGVLERVLAVRAVLFDKTGTLTRGELKLTRVVREPAPELRPLLRHLAARSHHRVAQAIAHYYAKEAPPFVLPESVAERAGEGVEAIHSGRVLRLGRAPFAAVDGSDADANVAFSIDGKPEAAFLVEDEPRPTSAAAVKALLEAGLQVAMVSGDVPARAQAVAALLGIREVFARQSPEDKVARLAEFRQRYGAVMFVGDGFNDAAALAAADVGVATQSGVDLARSAGSMVLLRSDPADLLHAFTLSKRAARVIRQNLVLASAYNLVALPWAAGWMSPFSVPALPPFVAGTLMAFSSLCVVLNAARLQRKARPRPRR